MTTDGRNHTTPAILSMPSETYHADPCDQPSLSASIAKLLITGSPAHAKAAHPKLNPDLVTTEETKFDIGTVAHALLLEGRDAVQVIDAPDWRSKDARALRDHARANGQTPLLAGQWSEVQAMCQATRAQLDKIECEPALFTDGLPEQTLIWHDDEFHVDCRARLDWLRDDLTAIDDFKTTSRSANPEGWTRSTLFSIGADVQAAFYLRGLAANGGSLDADFRFVVQETFAPYALTVVSLGPDVMALAEKKVRYALAVWAKCLRDDEWPAYPLRVCFAELPPWEESRWLERELREVAAA